MPQSPERSGEQTQPTAEAPTPEERRASFVADFEQIARWLNRVEQQIGDTLLHDVAGLDSFGGRQLYPLESGEELEEAKIEKAEYVGQLKSVLADFIAHTFADFGAVKIEEICSELIENLAQARLLNQDVATALTAHYLLLLRERKEAE